MQIEYSSALRSTMQKMQDLDEKRSHARLWWPRLPLIPSFGKQAEGTGTGTNIELEDTELDEEERDDHG
jgi:hypothetical protein